MKININGLDWNVKFITKEEDSEIWGCTRPSSLTICIRKDLNKDIVRTTITHEIIHSIIFSYGFVKPTSDTDMLFTEEQVCDFVGMNLQQIIQLSTKIYVQYLKLIKK